MKTCVIFCAGSCEGPVLNLRQDLVIAADGGLVHLRKRNIKPDVVIGDFDSLGYVPEGAQVFPVEKDDTDSMLAIRYGLKQGCHRFVLYGALEGPRPDHTVANYQALHFLADRGARGYLVGQDVIVTAIKNTSVSFPEEAEGTVSVFCLGADAQGVTLEGLQYPASEISLCAGFPLGVSNHFVGKTATVSVKDGVVLLFYPRQLGFV